MWRWSSNFQTSLLTKGVPLSIAILWGIPNLQMCFRMKLATAGLVAFFREMASTYFVKYSVTTNIQIWPLDGGLIGPIKSSPQVWNGQGVIMFWRLVGWVCMRFPRTWQVWHVFTHSAASCFMVGQKYPRLSSCWRSLLLPWWSPHSPPCTSCITDCASGVPRHLKGSLLNPFLKKNTPFHKIVNSQLSQAVGLFMIVGQDAFYKILKEGYRPIASSKDCTWFHLIKNILAINALLLDSGSLFAHFWPVIA